MRILIVLLAILFLMAMLAFSPMVATPSTLPPRATFTTAPTPDPDATPAPTDPPAAYPYPAPARHRKPETLREALEDFFGSH